MNQYKNNYMNKSLWVKIKCFFNPKLLPIVMDTPTNEELAAIVQEYCNKKFAEACSKDDYEQIKYWLTSPEIDCHADINHSNYSCSMLLCAIANGKFELAKYLLTSPPLGDDNFSIFNTDDKISSLEGFFHEFGDAKTLEVLNALPPHNAKRIAHEKGAYIVERCIMGGFDIPDNLKPYMTHLMLDYQEQPVYF